MRLPRSAVILQGLSGLLFCLVLWPQSAPAQGFSGRSGGFGSFGRGGSRGLLGELSSESVRAELQITPDQQTRLDALSEEQRNNRDQFSDIFQKFGSAQTEEERNQVREEMRIRFAEQRKQVDAQVKSVLNPDQAKRLEQLHLQHEGPSVLAGDEQLGQEFALSAAQKSELESLVEQRRSARMELGRSASDEARKKFDDEWTQRYLSVLTPEQKQKWTERTGPPPAATATAATGDPAPVVTPSTTPTPTPVPARPAMTLSADAAGENPSAPPTLSFHTDKEPSSAAKASEPEASTAGKSSKLSFNFRFAPWTDVLKLFAEEAGLSLDLNAIPPGTFNYYDKTQYTPTEALDVLNGYLLPKGYCLVRRDDFLVCVNIDEPIPPSLVPNISASELDQRGRNELLTVIFPLEGVDVGQVAVEVNDIKGPQGKVVGLKSTNSILVTDIGANLRRIRDLLEDVTARGGPNDITFKAYQVRNIAVADAEQIIRSLLGVTPAVSNVSAATDDRRRDSRRSSSAPPGESDRSPVRVAIDPRTNQLLVTATLAQHLLVEQALKTIDVDGEPSQFSPANTRPFLKVYQVTSADAREVTKTIDSLIPGIVVNEDGRNGKIHIQATPDQHRQVETLIAQMDGLGGSRQMAVIPLSTLDPTSVAATLRSMFLKDGEAAPTIEADLYGRQLMIRGSADQLAQIRTLLTQLGEDGTGQRANRDDARARTIPLSGRDPQELVPILERMWKANNSAPIRVVTPPARTGSDDFRPSTQSRPAPHSQPVSNPADSAETDKNSVRVKQFSTRRIPVLTAAQSQPVESQPAETPTAGQASAPEQSPPSRDDAELDRLLDEYLDSPSEGQAGPGRSSPANSQKADAEVNIVVMGDELFVTSSDPAQLDQLEELLQKTMQAIPPRVTWTVFTLKVADATEAANMLKLFFPGSSVSAASTSSSGSMLDGLSSSAASLGSSLSSMTGLGSLGAADHLQIIPDVRLNALFVAGPASRVREVEEMLKVLDSTDLGGDSLRDKLARMIPIEHANADEVYNIVKDVYKNYIDPPRAAQNDNPFAMFSGGSRRGGRGEEQGPAVAPKLALGVDKSTSHLIVWADDNLFHEIESLVTSMDQAAAEARRTVRVVNLENTNSTVIQGALGSLMPQVKVSVTGSRQSSTSSSSPAPTPSPSSSGSSGGSDSDQIRQFFEQRMRDRMRGGDSGDRGSDRGSSRSFGGFGGPGGSGGFGGFRSFGGGRDRGSRGR